jgi:hypothetical protein
MSRSSLANSRQQKAIGTAVVTMGMLAGAGAFAPAAFAAPDTTEPPTALPSEESTPTADVLTQAPVAAAAATPAGAHYGTGKRTIGLESSDEYVPDGALIDPTGAQVTMTFSKQNDVRATASSTCTFVRFPQSPTSCSFPATPGFPATFLGVDVPPGAEFTLELVTQPDSGQLLVLEGSSSTVLQGYTSSADDTPDPHELPQRGFFVLSAPGGYRTLGVAVAGTGDRSGSTFELCPDAGGDCVEGAEPVDPDVAEAPLEGMGAELVISATTDAEGRATFDGIHLPGTYRVVQTSAPAGKTFDASPRELVVAAATTLADRAVPVRLSVEAPVAVAPSPTTPAPATPPVSTPPTPTTPPASAPLTSSPPAPSEPPVGTPAADAVAVPTIAAGRQQTIRLSGFQPYEMVHGVLHPLPVDLGTVQADANGNATVTFTVPADLATGAHSVTMTGLTSGVERTAGFVVTSSGDAGAGDEAVPVDEAGGLAYTGAEVAPLLALGGGLLVAGAGAVTVARRRRTT